MTLTHRSARRWIWAAVVAGFALRAAFGAFYWVGKPLTHDEREYLALSRSLTEGRGFAHDPAGPAGTTQQFGRAPGYPVFLALAGAGRSAHEQAPGGVKLIQAVVGGATIWLFALISMRAAGPRAGVAAAVLAAIYPPLIWTPAYVFSETIYTPLAFGAAHLLQRSLDASSEAAATGSRTAAAAGVLAGVALLVRPALLFFLPLAVVWMVRRRRLALAALFTAAVILVVAPWTIRNLRTYGRFVLVASEGGVTFWTGNHPLARGEGDLAANPELKLAELEFRRAHPGLTSEELEPLYYREALTFIRDHPLRWLGLLARKAFYTVVPIGPSYTLHSTRYWAASVVSYLLLLALAIAGFGGLWRSPGRPTAVLLLGASAVLVGIVFFPQERFRIPVIDPVLIISAAALAAPARREPA